MNKKVLLYSGGMDSLIAWFYIDLPIPTCLYVNLNHRYADKELNAMDKIPIPYQLLSTNYGQYFEKENAHIPGRNLILAMYAAGMGADEIYLVCQKGEQNIPDRTDEFFKSTSELLTFHFERPIKMINPFSHMTKVDMVRWYVQQGHSVQHLLKSVSCYDGETQMHCGVCSSCFRKHVALTLNGIDCNHIFNVNPKLWGIENYKDRLDEYGDVRKEELLRYFE